MRKGVLQQIWIFFRIDKIFNFFLKTLNLGRKRHFLETSFFNTHSATTVLLFLIRTSLVKYEFSFQKPYIIFDEGHFEEL